MPGTQPHPHFFHRVWRAWGLPPLEGPVSGTLRGTWSPGSSRETSGETRCRTRLFARWVPHRLGGISSSGRRTLVSSPFLVNVFFSDVRFRLGSRSWRALRRKREGVYRDGVACSREKFTAPDERHFSLSFKGMGPRSGARAPTLPRCAAGAPGRPARRAGTPRGGAPARCTRWPW